MAESGSAAVTKPPFALRTGSVIQLGPRTGRVEDVRGNRGVPYDVKIVWEGSKYPEWFQYVTLRHHYDRGVLTVF